MFLSSLGQSFHLLPCLPLTDIKTVSSRLLYEQDLGNARCQKRARTDPVLAPSEMMRRPFSALFLPLKWHIGIPIHFSSISTSLCVLHLSISLMWGMGLHRLTPIFPVGSTERWQEMKYYGAEGNGPRVVQTCSCSCEVLDK